MKKLVCTPMALMLVAGLLAGCGSTPASGSGTGTGTGSGTASAGGGTTLTVYAGTALFAEAVDTIVADYKSETGITIEWEIPGEEPYTLLKTRFAANEAPDVFDLANGDFAAWGVRCEDLSGEAWIDHTDPTAIAPATVDGQVLGFPYAVEGNGIVYNKDLFTQAGIDKIPETLDELEAACEKL